MITMASTSCDASPIDQEIDWNCNGIDDLQDDSDDDGVVDWYDKKVGRRH